MLTILTTLILLLLFCIFKSDGVTLCFDFDDILLKFLPPFVPFSDQLPLLLTQHFKKVVNWEEKAEVKNEEVAGCI